MKQKLVEIYLSSILKVNPDLNVLKELKESGLASNDGLTERGRSMIKVVLAGGVFDIIHLMKTVQIVRPDIIALGYDQAHSESEFSENSKKMGINVKVVRVDSPYPSIKSRNIKNDPRAGWI